MGRNVLVGLSVAALAGALGYAWWSDGHPRPPPPPAKRVPPPVADGHPAPFEAFASARVGDWYAYRVVNGGSMGEIRTTAMTWVTEQTDGAVTRSWRGKIDATGEDRTGAAEDFPRAGLTVRTRSANSVVTTTITTAIAMPHETREPSGLVEAS